MEEQNVKRRQRELSAQQASYVKNRATGLSRQASAIAAGYSDWDGCGKDVESSPVVQEALAVARKEYEVAGGVKKEDVMAGLLDAANMAKIMADPQAMIAAWREIGKMCGYYAPEVKKVEHEHSAKGLLGRLASLTDAELLSLAHGRVIDGEVSRLDEPAGAPDA